VRRAAPRDEHQMITAGRVRLFAQHLEL